MPFDRVDTEWTFDIREGDLFKWIEEYSWQHPATKQMNDIRERSAALKLCEQHGIKIPKPLMDMLDNLNVYIDAYEELCRKLHSIYPGCSPAEISHAAIQGAMNEARSEGCDISELNILAEKLFADYTRDLNTKNRLLYGRNVALLSLLWVLGETSKRREQTRKRRERTRLDNVLQQTADDMAAIRAVWASKEKETGNED